MIDALLLIQDVQLLCFTVIFGCIWLQHPTDRTRRWLFYGFLASSAGALLDFASPYVPAWFGHEGLSLAMIPLSYALTNVAITHFVRRYRSTLWISVVIVVGTLPFFLLWSTHAESYPSHGLRDLAIAVQGIVAGYILLGSNERSTRPPRLLLSSFYVLFAALELNRAFFALVLHRNPDVFSPKTELSSAISYIIAASVLPLAFVWLLNTRLESDLVHQNMIDPLTQVLNRRGLRKAMDHEVALHEVAGGTLTVAILDLDRFKLLNDTYGHATGDVVLIAIASLLRKSLRGDDIVARLGGEEFLLLLPQTSGIEALALLEHLRIQIENHAEITDTATIRITASLGATTTRPKSPYSSSDLLREADLALYRAKQDGRNRVEFHI